MQFPQQLCDLKNWHYKRGNQTCGKDEIIFPKPNTHPGLELGVFAPQTAPGFAPVVTNCETMVHAYQATLQLQMNQYVQ